MKCVIFDIDGTLFDTADGIIGALNETVCKYGGKKIKESDASSYIGPPVFQSLRKYQEFSEEKVKEATEYYRKIYVEKYVYNSSAYCGTLEVIASLKEAGNKIAIATMKTRKQVEALLHSHNMDAVFDIIKYALEDGSLTKADMLKQIKREIFANSYIMVGDTLGDYNAAKAADMEFIFAEYGYGDINDAGVKKIGQIGDLLKMI